MTRSQHFTKLNTHEISQNFEHSLPHPFGSFDSFGSSFRTYPKCTLQTKQCCTVIHLKCPVIGHQQINRTKVCFQFDHYLCRPQCSIIHPTVMVQLHILCHKKNNNIWIAFQFHLIWMVISIESNSIATSIQSNIAVLGAPHQWVCVCVREYECMYAKQFTFFDFVLLSFVFTLKMCCSRIYVRTYPSLIY